MANGDLIKLGTLYVNGIKQPNPMNGGDIPKYTSGNIEIKDTDVDDAYKIKWIEVILDDKKFLVADRNILASVSWDILNGQGLITGKDITIDGKQCKLRLLTGGSFDRDKNNNEWDKIITDDNNKWHWVDSLSWVQNLYRETVYRVVRGGSSARSSGYTGSNDSQGWRPVFEVLPQTKYLVQNKNNNLFKIINDVVIDLGIISPIENVFIKQGMNIMPLLTEAIITQIGNCKVLKWTDSGIVNHTLNIQVEYKDKLFKCIEGYKLKMWTDDVSISTAKLNYSTEPYRPIDKLDEKFKVLMYKE
ncbi:hypothetical protein [Clostridium tagluense]|uniref:Uncharacterized protein n=1 Tax=Clostridium tagluense TaxID=360422 RepID=A0A401UQH1_9CLOT|nr:hypothetical protein [Clostridium tagluense]GCD11777.1 hypothetical protein Ctaglu_34000 [Clostridium tagluense]